jgi:CelD/BcsL family acetyltransferase involved in cellulose biosynthesis
MPALAYSAKLHVEASGLEPSLAEDWNRLAGDVPCRRWEWLAPWWRHYWMPDAKLFVLVVREEEGQVHAIAPWYVRGSLAQGRVIRFLGSGDVCSDYLTIMSDPEHRPASIKALVDFLMGSVADEWDSIELTGVSAGDETIGQFIGEMQRRDVLVHQQAGESCWRLGLPGDWDKYVSTLSKTRRERTRQIVRRNFNAGRVSIKQAANEVEARELYELLIELHQKRRTSLGEEGCFADPRFTAYHREVIENFLRAGRLRLQGLFLDGRPAAIVYELIGGDSIYLYQSGIETDLLHERPGWLGTISSVRSAIAQGYRTFDFMRGDEDYKASWGAQAAPMVETRLVAPRATAMVRHKAWRARQQMRRWLKARWERFRAARVDNGISN